jgi:hypothetical protein
MQDNDYGIDWNEPLTTEDENATVTVPHTNCLLSDADYQILNITFPQDSSFISDGSYGIYTYLKVRTFVQERIEFED